MAPGNDAGVPAVLAAARRALPPARQSRPGPHGRGREVVR